MKNLLNGLSFITLSVFLVVNVSAAPIEFVATVDSIGVHEGRTILNVDVTPTLTIPVIIAEQTEIKSEDGLPATLEDLVAVPNQTVEIEALMTASGFLALEVKMVDASPSFELKGSIADKGADFIVVHGLTVKVPPTAEIKDQFRDSLEFADLEIGDLVRVEGTVQGDDLVAEEIKVMSEDSPFARISVEGVVTAIAGDLVTVAVEEGVEVLVVTSDSTKIIGTLAVGAYVKVTGILAPDLKIEALKIKVRKLLSLSPDKLKMAFGDVRKVNVILRAKLPTPLVLVLSTYDPGIAAPAVAELTIPAGSHSASFDVIAGSVAGETRINVTVPPSLGSFTENVDVRVGETSGENDPDIKWTPRVIHAAPKGVRMVDLHLRHGLAATDLPVSITLAEGQDDLVIFPAQVVIPEGKSHVRFELEFLKQTGQATLRAALPAELGSETDDLEIDLKSHGQAKLGISWEPKKVEALTETAFSVELRLDEPAPWALMVTISVRNGNPSVISGYPAEVPFAEGETSKVIDFQATDVAGKLGLRAALPAEAGGRHADLKIDVEE